MAVKQTAGRDQLGAFAPKFAQLNDDVLFGEVWSREDKLSLRDRSLVTVVSLLSQGLVDSSFQFHLMSAKKNGITRSEIAEIITHAAFYAGWPKAWAAFRMAKEVWADEEAQEPEGGLFGLGAPNDAYAAYFVGQSYLKPLGGENGVFAANVTFEPGCRNNWHIHHAAQGGGQDAAGCQRGRKRFLLQPSRFARRYSSSSSGTSSSPSPMRARSIKSARGSALYMAVPPAMTSGARESRSPAWRGIPERSNIFRMAG